MEQFWNNHIDELLGLAEEPKEVEKKVEVVEEQKVEEVNEESEGKYLEFTINIFS